MISNGDWTFLTGHIGLEEQEPEQRDGAGQDAMALRVRNYGADVSAVTIAITKTKLRGTSCSQAKITEWVRALPYYYIFKTFYVIFRLFRCILKEKIRIFSKNLYNRLTAQLYD